MATLREKAVEIARSQLGVRYWSMHYGPKGSSSEGFGCAQFCRYVYKQLFGVDYVGSCYNYAGDALGQSVNQGGGEFKFIGANEALPGDAVLYGASGLSGSDYDDYGHIALYIGGGKVIGAMGQGVPGQSGYLNIGISETTVAKQSIGGVTRYIRCTRFEDSAPTLWPVQLEVAIVTDNLAVRDAPTTSGSTVITRYSAGSKVNIDGVVFADGRLWGHYIGGTSGKDRYVSLGTLNNVSF